MTNRNKKLTYININIIFGLQYKLLKTKFIKTLILKYDIKDCKDFNH